MAKRDLIKEACEDARALKDAALAAAEAKLIDRISPALKRLIENETKSMLSEDTDRIRRGVQDNWPGESHTGFEEAKGKEGEIKMDKEKDQELDLESIASFFPVSEESEPEAEEDEKKCETAIPTLEAASEEPEAEKEGDVDEEIEISEEALRAVYEAALQTEVQVKKGFGDMTKTGELDDVAKDVGKGLNPAKTGENAWETVEPPAKEDFTVKEQIARGMRENKMLRAHLGEAVKMIKRLSTKLHEVNLFNGKVLHVNKLLSQHRLTKEQRDVVMESMDSAKNLAEVKRIYETITKTFKASTSLTEGKARSKPIVNAQRATRSGAPDERVLSESADRANGNDFSRMQELAGLLK